MPRKLTNPRVMYNNLKVFFPIHRFFTHFQMFELWKNYATFLQFDVSKTRVLCTIITYEFRLILQLTKPFSNHFSKRIKHFPLSRT